MRHGWIIRHRLSDSFVDVTDPEFPQIVADATKATLFPTEGEAHVARCNILLLPLIRTLGQDIPMDLGVEERAFHDAPPADANPEFLISRAEILEGTFRDGTERRLAHQKARALFNEQPSGVLIPHPDTAWS